MKQRREIYHKHRDTIRELLSDYEIKNATDLNNALKEIFAGTIEEMLAACVEIGIFAASPTKYSG